jgi:hypothetical protein
MKSDGGIKETGGKGKKPLPIPLPIIFLGQKNRL